MTYGIPSPTHGIPHEYKDWCDCKWCAAKRYPGIETADQPLDEEYNDLDQGDKDFLDRVMATTEADTPEDHIHKAIGLVYGARNDSYGHPHDDYTRTAGLWSAFLGFTITAEQAALMMVLLKVSREKNQHKDDNIVDAHGYLLCAGRIRAREAGLE